MKNSSIFNTKWRAAFGSLAGLAALILAVSASPASALPSSAAGTVLSPTEPQYGFSYQEWSAQWWQWALSRPTNNFPQVGLPTCLCSGAAHVVRFLEGAPGSITATRHITISREAALFFPIISVWVDNTDCPDFTTNTLDQLVAEAAGLWTGVTEVSCSIDGVPVAGLTDPESTIYHVQAPAFSYTTATKDNVLAGYYGEPCIGGAVTVYPAVADGVYLMVAPFKPGKHIIHFTGVVPSALDVDLTYDIIVTAE